ncbi:MAG TPA: flavodoxin family protein [Desulfobacterales bacterium]|nr:flavodoxin family protein [Desulfobacterales bacterium]
MATVLALNGSPRRGGNTEVLLREVAEGVRQAGGEIEIIGLSSLTMSPCIACGGCTKTGKCVINDDMQGLYDKVQAAKQIIIASPIYFYALSAQTKIFIDRLQAMWSRKQLLRAAKKWHPDPFNKGYLVSVAATRGPRIFEGAVLCARYAYDALGLEYGGEFLARGFDGRGEVGKDDKKLRQAVEFGINIVSRQTSA